MMSAWEMAAWEAEFVTHMAVSEAAVVAEAMSEAVQSAAGACERAMQLAEGDALLTQRLAIVKATFDYFKTVGEYHQQWLGDNLEARAAVALRQVDDLIHRQARGGGAAPPSAMEELRMLQRWSQDVAVLACSRYIPLALLHKKGICAELLGRFNAAFGARALADDLLWSRLGNAKYQMFSYGVRFNENSNGRRGRARAGRGKAPDATEVDVSVWGEPLYIHLPLGGQPGSLFLSTEPPTSESVAAP